MGSMRYLVVVKLFLCVLGQPPGGGCSASIGQSSSSLCSINSGTCSSDGSMASAKWSSITYNTGTGVFSGTVYANQCAHDVRATQQSNVAFSWFPVTPVTAVTNNAAVTCCSTTLPVSGYTVSSSPIAAPLTGVIGISMYGENIYGPLDNGFSSTSQNLCTSGSGGCPKLSDVAACQNYAEFTCGTAKLTTGLLLSDCGGHASWHYHIRANCALNSSWTWATAAAAQGHSPLAGVMIDGRGLYGPYESGGTLANNTLDACNGHYGPVPAFYAVINGVGVSFPAGTNVYHYHITAGAPFFVGCFGPATSVAVAKALYSGCSASGGTCTSTNALAGSCSAGQTWTACTSVGQYTNYILGCPVYQGLNSQSSIMEYNTPNQPVPSVGCPACTGACGDVSPSPSPSPVSASSSASPVSSTNTRTGTPSVTGTRSGTATNTATSTASLTFGASPSNTATTTMTASDTSTVTASATPSPTAAVSTSALAGAASATASVTATQTRAAAIRITIVANVPSAASGAAVSGATAVLAALQTNVSTLLGVSSSAVQVSITSFSRRRVLQTSSSSVTWFVLVTPPSAASVTTITAAVSAATATSLTTALSGTFAAMANIATAGSTQGYAAASITCTSCSSGDGSSSVLSTGAIIGIVIGSVAAAAIIAAIATWLCCPSAAAAACCCCCSASAASAEQVVKPPPAAFMIDHPSKRNASV